MLLEHFLHGVALATFGFGLGVLLMLFTDRRF